MNGTINEQDNSNYTLKTKPLVPFNSSLIISFPSAVEFHEWCEKLCLLLTAKFPSHPQIVKITNYLSSTLN